jgi:hypothetical protein
MTEAEAAMKLGENLGVLLVFATKIPVVIASPIVALFGLGSFLLGKKYERKWNKKSQEKVFTVDDINQIVIPSEGETSGEYSQ